MPYNATTGKFERPTEAGVKREIGKGNQFAGCRDGESEAGCAKRKANWQRSYDRRGGVRFSEMNTAQRKSFLAAGGKRSALEGGIKTYIQRQRAKAKQEETPTPKPREDDYGEGPKGNQNRGAQPSRSPSGMSREERQRRVVQRRALAAARGPLGGR